MHTFGRDANHPGGPPRVRRVCCPAVDNGHKRRFHHVINSDTVFGTHRGSSCRQLVHCIQRYETEVFAKVIWGAQCRKSARWVLLGETSSRSHARSVRALARKRQITVRLRKGLPLQGSSLPSFGFRFSVHTGTLSTAFHRMKAADFSLSFPADPA